MHYSYICNKCGHHFNGNTIICPSCNHWGATKTAKTKMLQTLKVVCGILAVLLFFSAIIGYDCIAWNGGTCTFCDTPNSLRFEHRNTFNFYVCEECNHTIVTLFIH